MPSSSSLLLPLLLASTLCFLASADLPRNTLGDDTIANEDQPELWGLVKMPGGMAGFEFFVAHFSAPLVCGEQRVVVADPADGCGTQPLHRAVGRLLHHLPTSILQLSRMQCYPYIMNPASRPFPRARMQTARKLAVGYLEAVGALLLVHVDHQRRRLEMDRG